MIAKSDTDIKRICLWSGPRNISTTLMYSFAQRLDTTVVDEPLYAFYLKNHHSASTYHPKAPEIMASMQNDGQKVIADIFNANDTPIYFYKNMTHHLLDLDKQFMKDTINLLLTRDPIEMLPSYGKVVKDPSLEDVGYELHLRLIEYFAEQAIAFVVLDSKRILLNPKQQLTKLCRWMNIDFDSSMLSWKPGARREDGIWSKIWYKSIHQSTGFLTYKKKTETFPEHLLPLLMQCQPLYKKLLDYAL